MIFFLTMKNLSTVLTKDTPFIGIVADLAENDGTTKNHSYGVKLIISIKIYYESFD